MSKLPKFPETIWVTWSEGDDEPYLVAWESLNAADKGKVASYRLVDELETREVVEARRKGTNKWFKA